MAEKSVGKGQRSPFCVPGAHPSRKLLPPGDGLVTFLRPGRTGAPAHEQETPQNWLQGQAAVREQAELNEAPPSSEVLTPASSCLDFTPLENIPWLPDPLGFSFTLPRGWTRERDSKPGFTSWSHPFAQPSPLTSGYVLRIGRGEWRGRVWTSLHEPPGLTLAQGGPEKEPGPVPATPEPQCWLFCQSLSQPESLALGSVFPPRSRCHRITVSRASLTGGSRKLGHITSLGTHLKPSPQEGLSG
nr:uncharacterized protein LOC106823026 [Equus asinus]